MDKIPAILTIAGSDGSAGAGVQADLLTFHDLKLKGICVITSLVTQVPQQTIAVKKRSDDDLKQELSLLADYYDIQAIKIGLISSLEQLLVIKDFINSYKQGYPLKPVVLDPVGIASTGFSMQDNDVDLSVLFPLCDLITPNINEAQHYLNTNTDSLDDLKQAAKSFYDKFQCPVLIKGGHLNNLKNNQIYDVYADVNQVHVFSNQVIQGLTEWHGTGCKLSSAITGYLSLNHSVLEAIDLAKTQLQKSYLTK